MTQARQTQHESRTHHATDGTTYNVTHNDVTYSVSEPSIIVAGAGPAGLTAAYHLLKRGQVPLVLEATDKIGGIARTEQYRGYRFDIGGHRFFTKVPAVDALWREILGEDMLTVARLSRIYYHRKFYQYPLKAGEALRQLGLAESVRILFSYARYHVAPISPESSFEEWVVNRFGRRLYEIFFKSYTEKVWGIPCAQIRADWAAQRIKDLSLISAAFDAMRNSFGGQGNKTHITSLIGEFQYPRLGPGMMWERMAKRIQEQGGRLWMQTKVTRVCHSGGRVTGIQIERPDGERSALPVRHLISSMPLALLIRNLEPAPPPEVVEAAARLRYRDFLIVCVIVRRKKLFPDQWIYVHEPGVKVGRIQNFVNWSAEMVPDPETTSLGLEYFCNEGDSLWAMPDAELVDLAARELDTLGLTSRESVIDGIVVRQEKAYPVYDENYRKNVAVIRDYLATFANLQSVGRNGMHRYNNQDHSMLTAMFAVENMGGGEHDLWDVNTERSYYEEFLVPNGPRAP